MGSARVCSGHVFHALGNTNFCDGTVQVIDRSLGFCDTYDTLMRFVADEKYIGRATTKSGWLQKFGKRQFRQRYFVFETEPLSLHIYRDKGAEVVYSCSIAEALAIRSTEAMKEKDRFCFEIVLPTDILIVATKSDKERQEWVRALLWSRCTCGHHLPKVPTLPAPGFAIATSTAAEPSPDLRSEASESRSINADASSSPGRVDSLSSSFVSSTSFSQREHPALSSSVSSSSNHGLDSLDDLIQSRLAQRCAPASPVGSMMVDGGGDMSMATAHRSVDDVVMEADASIAELRLEYIFFFCLFPTGCAC